MSRQQASDRRRHTILLGGLGGDSHSVGLTILRQGLSANGYHVEYLGTQNTLADFFQMAGLTNLVMISSMDGHARYYLREFPALKREFNTNGTIWYLGGNLGVSESYERDFIEMGFHRVFMKFIELTTVLNMLERDLEGVQAVANYPELWKHVLPVTCCFPGVASDSLLEHETFESRRRGDFNTGKPETTRETSPAMRNSSCSSPRFPERPWPDPGPAALRSRHHRRTNQTIQEFQTGGR